MKGGGRDGVNSRVGLTPGGASCDNKLTIYAFCVCRGVMGGFMHGEWRKFYFPFEDSFYLKTVSKTCVFISIKNNYIKFIKH